MSERWHGKDIKDDNCEMSMISFGQRFLFSNPFFNYDQPVSPTCKDPSWCTKRTGRRNMTLLESTTGRNWTPVLGIFQGSAGYSSLAALDEDSGIVAIAYERSQDWPLDFASLNVAIVQLKFTP